MRARYAEPGSGLKTLSSPEVAEGLDGGREPRGPALCLVSKHRSRVSGLSLRSLAQDVQQEPEAEPEVLPFDPRA